MANTIGSCESIGGLPRVAVWDANPDTSPSRLPMLLTVLGIAASSVALWAYIQALPLYVDPDIFDFSRVLKPPLYYVAHGLEVLCLCAAGLIALGGIPQHRLSRYGVRFLLFAFAGAVMSIRGYSFSTAASTQIFSNLGGPFTIIVSLLIFAGAQPGNWRVLDKLLIGMAILYSALTAIGMLGVESASRFESVLALGSLLNALYFPSVWLLLRPGSLRSVWGVLRYAPFATYALGSIFTQTRLNFVMMLAAFSAYIYVQRRRRVPTAPKLLFAAALAALVLLFSTAYLKETTYLQTLQASSEAFVERIDEDTRTGQMIEFFKNVPISELVLGRGSLATWNWGGMEWNGGTDVGYLSLLFFGGLPLLFTYLALHVAPAIGAIRRPESEWQTACAAIALLWALRMFSSAYPGLAVEYYPVLLCIGGCLAHVPTPQIDTRTGL